MIATTQIDGEYIAAQVENQFEGATDFAITVCFGLMALLAVSALLGYLLDLLRGR